MPPLLPTETIVNQLKQADEIDGVTRYLYKTYERSLRGFIRRQGGSADDADDLIQEVMITFLQQVRSGRFEQRPNAELGSYLTGIARRKLLKKMESDNRRLKRQYWFAIGTGLPETPDDIVSDADYQGYALTQFLKLGDLCQSVLTAFYRDHRSLDDIAVSYNLGSVGAVKMRKLRCIQKLLKRTYA